MSEEVKPLFKNSFLSQIRYGDNDWVELYPVFSALRGPDFDLESSFAVKFAFTLRVRAALSKEFYAVEKRIKEEHIMELAFVKLYKDLSLNWEAKSQRAAFLHFFSHLENAFHNLCLLAENQVLKEYYAVLANICESITHYIVTEKVSYYFDAVKRALDYGFVSVEGFSDAFNYVDNVTASYFADLLKQYVGIEVKVKSIEGEK